MAPLAGNAFRGPVRDSREGTLSPDPGLWSVYLRELDEITEQFEEEVHEYSGSRREKLLARLQTVARALRAAIGVPR